MTQQGRLTEWNDDRGFGFITPLDEGPRVFVHVSAFPRAARRPVALDLVTYDSVRDERGRLRAERVAFLTPVRAKHAAARSATPAGSGVGSAGGLAVAGGFLGIVGLVALVGAVPGWLFGVDVVLSVILFMMYGADKSAAQQGEWRTSEATLHLFALLGGWPGALAAQQMFRHKTKKQSFRFVFWLTVAGNLGALVWLAVALGGTAGA